jgi:GTP-binding protein HflX
VAKTARDLILIEPEIEKAVLVGVEIGRSQEAWTMAESFDELEQLANTAGASVVGRVSQQLDKHSKNYYLGKGKLEELINLQESLGYNLVIFNDELSALQQRNLEDELGVKIIDRVALIIDIFAKRARTREGILQVDLAQTEYLLPRLAGQWSHLERLGGGIGTRGPGETQIETDRRLAQKKINRLKKEIENIKKRRSQQRKTRKNSEIPSLALVGYTNTGKSTILNVLSDENIFTEDKLFATLDPTTRRVILPDNSVALISDTVGFIRKLPPGLVSAFQATIEEISHADILLHVVDLSNPRAAEQYEITESLLEDMSLSQKPRITILNKADRVLDSKVNWNEQKAIDFIKKSMKGSFSDNLPDTVILSATRAWGIRDLGQAIISAIHNMYNAGK